MDKKKSAGKIILGQDRFGREISRELDSVDSMTNNNLIVVGSSGAGKTTSVVIPNIVQEGQNIVVSDPKGSLLRQYGAYLEQMYDIRILNIKDFSRSMHYNPLAYCENERDVVMLANIICSHTVSGKSRKTSDDYWTESARNLLTALITYVLRHSIDGNINDVLELIKKEETFERDEAKTESLLDFYMGADNNSENEFIENCYSTYKQAANVTRASIITSLLQMLSIFMVGEVRECMRYDELNLDDFFAYDYYHETGKRVALFIIQDDVDETKNIFATIIYAQLFSLACHRADIKYNSRLETPLRFFLDDFATAGLVPRFAHLISNIRSRNISVMIAVQNESQLFSIYGDDAKTIIGNCNYYIYMGSTDICCRKEVAQRYGISLQKLASFDKRKCLVDMGNGYQEMYKYYDKNLMKKIKTDSYDINPREKNPIYKNLMLGYIHSRNRDEIIGIDEWQRGLEERRRSRLNRKANKEHNKKTFENELKHVQLDSDKLLEDICRTTSEYGLEEAIDDATILEEINTIELKSSVFDSYSEEKFYKKLIEYFGDIDSVVVVPHMSLAVIFYDRDKNKKGKEKYRLVNMHCDFVLMDKYTQKIYMAIEVDGPDHDKPEQKERDMFKSLLFEHKGPVLCRIKASDVDGGIPIELIDVFNMVYWKQKNDIIV